MKNYIIFCALFLPNLGGVERYTYNLSRELIRKGNHVTVVTSHIPGTADHDDIDGIEVYRLPCIGLLNGRFPVLKPDQKCRDLVREIGKRKYDFGVIQTRFYVHSLFAAYYLKRNKIPGIVVEHGTGHFTVNSKFWDAAGAVYEHIETAMLRCLCRDYYGVSQDCTKWTSHFGIKPKGVLYNAVDLEDIQEKLKDTSVDYRKQFGLEDRVVICYAGRLVREKGVLKLIDAVNKLNAEGEKLTLLVAGDGDLYEELCARKMEHVIMLGRQDFAHVVALYRDADIFSLPTDYPEGFPTSVLEAAACHCYIITTTNGGSKELLINEEYGAVLHDNTTDNIAAEIKRAAKDPQFRKNATEKTYQKLCDSFTWERVTEKLIAIQGEMNHD